MFTSFCSIRSILFISSIIGVLKEFRRKGLATALKIKAVEVLLRKGVTQLRTDNEENNPMYKINVALGFKPVPFSLDYSKEI